LIFNKSYTDLELVLECRKNSRKAQEQLFKRFYPQMMSYCMNKTQNREQSEEIINNAFLKVFKNMDKVTEENLNLAAWIKTVLKHTLIDYFRINQNKKGLVLDNRVYEMLLTCESEQTTEQDFAKIEHALALLPAKTKLVFSKFALEGFKHEEIAKELNMSAGTSRWHVAEARRILQSLSSQFFLK
jgi:RNA polymerase sigma-70 factor (ECF subfamily)